MGKKKNNYKNKNKKHVQPKRTKNKFIIPFAIVVTVVLLAVIGWTIKESDSPYYVGMDKCLTCHQKDFEKMKANPSMSRMLTAIDRLQGEEASTPKCLGCHTTGYEKNWDENVPFSKRVNVQCEACHGPGSKYLHIMKKGYSKSNAKQREEAIAAGLIVSPTKDTCFQCHHDGDIGPDGQPIIWDFEGSKAKILH